MLYLLIVQLEDMEIRLQTIFHHVQVHVLLDSIVLSTLPPPFNIHVQLEDMEVVMD